METKKYNPYNVVEIFEGEMAQYTGAKFAISLDNCTNALFLCLMYQKHEMQSPIVQQNQRQITIPSKTYLSVPMSIIHAGFEPVFDYSMNNWSGIYQLKPYPIFDAAKRLTSNMYIPNTFMCLSFHVKKPLTIPKGGMILTDDESAVEWLKRVRYMGRSGIPYHEDDITMLGWNMYMTPQQAIHGLALLNNYPINAPDFVEEYRDLTEFTVFKHYKKINN